MFLIFSLVGSTLCSGIACGQQFAQQQAAGYPGAQTQYTNTAAGSPVLQGLEGLHGFGSGHSQLSMAVIPLSQQNNQMLFQLIGFAVSIPETGEAVVYSLETPLPGIIDPSQSTMQIDISNLADVIGTAGYIDSSEVYDTIRTDPRVVIIEADLYYQGTEGSQTIFNVNNVGIVFPDGQMQAFALQQPTQLIIDSQSNRIAMVAFPQMISSFGSTYGMAYSQVEPVIYSQPVIVAAPILRPYIVPLPLFYTGFVPYNRFFFGSGFRPFWHRDQVLPYDRLYGQKRYPLRQPFNEFADRSRRDLQVAQRRGDFTPSRQLGTGITGGIGGFRGGVKTGAGVSTGITGGRAVSGFGGGRIGGAGVGIGRGGGFGGGRRR